MKAVVIIPALNESQVISQVLQGVKRELKELSDCEILVVDDGSTDDTYEKVLASEVKVVRHVVNRGLGAALKTGLTWAKNHRADIAVTFDSDGQHNPQDIKKIIAPILTNEADIVIGSRFKKRQNVPADRFIINWIANFTTLLIFGVLSTDSQSGLRAFSKKAIELIDFKSDRMEFSSEILLEAKKNNLRIKEVPIDAIYTKYSRLKGQKNTNAIPVFLKVLIRFLR